MTIANRMESGGKPGKIHITSDTLTHLDGRFIVEDGHGDQVISKHYIHHLVHRKITLPLIAHTQK